MGIFQLDRRALNKLLKDAYTGPDEIHVDIMSQAELIRRIFVSMLDRIKELEGKVKGLCATEQSRWNSIRGLNE
jgi:hypothetical protein